MFSLFDEIGEWDFLKNHVCRRRRVKNADGFIVYFDKRRVGTALGIEQDVMLSLQPGTSIVEAYFHELLMDFGCLQ